MRPSLPPVPVPGETPWERLDSAVRMAFSVKKETLVEHEKKETRQRARKRAKTPKKHN